MSFKEREYSILEYLRENKEATVSELCRALFVSEPTMRRDLATLNEQGRIVRTYGGAAYRSEPGENLPQMFREREESDAKALIGKRAAELVHDGDTIMVDGSSTALALLREIAARRSVAVITNSAKAAMVLADTGVKLFVTGGELAHNSYAYVGSHAEEYIRSFNADICFFSVRTLTADGRLTDNAIAENAVRLAMMKSSKKSILLLASKKLGAPCLNTLATLSDISGVVTETDVSDAFPKHKEKFI